MCYSYTIILERSCLLTHTPSSKYVTYWCRNHVFSILHLVGKNNEDNFSTTAFFMNNKASPPLKRKSECNYLELIDIFYLNFQSTSLTMVMIKAKLYYCWSYCWFNTAIKSNFIFYMYDKFITLRLFYKDYLKLGYCTNKVENMLLASVEARESNNIMLERPFCRSSFSS